MATDLSKSSVEQVLDLIRSSNDLTVNQFNSNDIDLIELQPLTIEGGKNTKITVASKPNARYIGNVDISYNRLALSGLSLYGDLTITINEGDGEQEILSAINAAYGTNLIFDDVSLSDIELIDFDGEFTTITAKATSLAWLGDITLLVKWSQIALSSILVDVELSGLNWPYVFKGLVEQLATIGIFPITSAALASTVINGVVHFFTGSYYTNRIYTIATGIDVGKSLISFTNSDLKGVFDGVVYTGSFSSSSKVMTLNVYSDINSASNTALILNFPTLAAASFNNSSSTALLAKKGDLIYCTVGASQFNADRFICSFNVVTSETAVLYGPLSKEAATIVTQAYSDLLAKSPLIGNDLFISLQTKIVKFNLLTNQLTDFITTGVNQNTIKMIGLGDRIVIINVTTFEIRVYSPVDASYEIIGLLTDYGISGWITMIEYENAVYVFEESPTGSRKVLKIT